MLIDTQQEFSVAQAVTATGDTASTNVYDTGAARDVGIGEEIYAFVRTDAAFTSAGAGTLQVKLQDSADNSTFADVQTLTAVLALAALTADTVIARVRLPIGLRRYLRLAYTVGTAAMTAGTVDAFLATNVQAYQFGSSGFSVE